MIRVLVALMLSGVCLMLVGCVFVIIGQALERWDK